MLCSHLTGYNVIHAINSCAIPILCYLAGIIDWTVDELQQLDRKTRKFLSLYRAFYRTSDVDHLYIPRHLGGRGLFSVYHCIRAEEHSLGNYISVSDESLLRLVASQNWFPVVSKSGQLYKARICCDLAIYQLD